MTNYTANDNFPTVQTYDTGDPVLGGMAGESNAPIEQLADRTQYLYNRLGSYLGQRLITASASITVTDVFKLLMVVTANNITLSLAAVAGFRVGSILKIKVKTTAAGPKCVSIIANGSESIRDGNISRLPLWLYDGEEIELVAADANDDGTADYWEMISSKGNFDLVGNDGMFRFLPRNTVQADGCKPESSGVLLSRADYARLWNRIKDIAIPDITWISDPVRFRSFFSQGNGSTTFRIADMRSMIWRGLDLGRGVSLARYDNSAGGYEPDELKAHNHRPLNGNGGSSTNPLGPGIGFSGMDTNGGYINDPFGNLKYIESTGGTETRMKNIGLIPAIYF